MVGELGGEEEEYYDDDDLELELYRVHLSRDAATASFGLTLEVLDDGVIEVTEVDASSLASECSVHPGDELVGCAGTLATAGIEQIMAAVADLEAAGATEIPWTFRGPGFEDELLELREMEGELQVSLANEPAKRANLAKRAEIANVISDVQDQIDELARHAEFRALARVSAEEVMAAAEEVLSGEDGPEEEEEEEEGPGAAWLDENQPENLGLGALHALHSSPDPPSPPPASAPTATEAVLTLTPLLPDDGDATVTLRGEDAEVVAGRGWHHLPNDNKIPRKHVRVWWSAQAGSWQAQTLGKSSAFVERRSAMMKIPRDPEEFELIEGDVLHFRRRDTTHPMKVSIPAGMPAGMPAVPAAAAAAAAEPPPPARPATSVPPPVRPVPETPPPRVPHTPVPATPPPVPVSAPPVPVSAPPSVASVKSPGQSAAAPRRAGQGTGVHGSRTASPTTAKQPALAARAVETVDSQGVQEHFAGLSKAELLRLLVVAAERHPDLVGVWDSMGGELRPVGLAQEKAVGSSGAEPAAAAAFEVKADAEERLRRLREAQARLQRPKSAGRAPRQTPAGASTPTGPAAVPAPPGGPWALSPPETQFVMPSAAERRVAFDRMDVNGNGGLSLAEIDKAIIELYPAFNHKPALMRAYKAADRDDSGFITRRVRAHSIRPLGVSSS